MKKSFLIYFVLFGIILFVISTIFSSGNKHITVVEENQILTKENTGLKKENSTLKTLNKSLTEINQKLKEQVSKPVTSKNQVYKPEINEDNLLKIVLNIEEEIDSDLGWCTADIAYTLLSEKLNKTPTREDMKKTLEDLHKKDMLYFPGSPDPYLRGKKYTKKDIDKYLIEY